MPTRNFDKQAVKFDGRAGLPDSVAETIARTVARIGSMRAGDLLLEIGAGTGQIGIHLGSLAGRYLGLDVSAPMLEMFARHARRHGISPTLIKADAGEPWPVQDRSVKTIFGSRVFHLLPPDHVATEFFRAASPAGATLIIGRVQRSPESLRSRLRHEMRARLQKAGFPPAGNREFDAALLAICRKRGATAFDPLVAATWQVAESVSRTIEAWAEKDGLAGLDVPPAVKSAILRGLEVWSLETFGSTANAHGAEEKYVLEGVRLPPD